MKKNDLKCCGNCKWRMFDLSEEYCELQSSETQYHLLYSKRVCKNWKFDKYKYIDRDIKK